jgi:hypothetical protein
MVENERPNLLNFFGLKRVMGLEPTIFCLGSKRSTTELHPQRRVFYLIHLPLARKMPKYQKAPFPLMTTFIVLNKIDISSNIE